MATYVVKAEMALINAVDLTDHLIEGNLTYEADMVDQTAMTSGTKVNNTGLLNWSMDLTFLQDFAASKVDATLFPLVGAAPFAVEVRPTNAARGATNPAYVATGVVSSYNPIAGKVGDSALARVTIKCFSALTRLTS
jgi:hypothetical protein